MADLKLVQVDQKAAELTQCLGHLNTGFASHQILLQSLRVLQLCLVIMKASGKAHTTPTRHALQPSHSLHVINFPREAVVIVEEYSLLLSL